MENSHSNTDPKQLHPINLNLQQYQAIEPLLIGKTDVEIAQLVGIESDTIWQWHNQNLESMIATSALRAAVWTDLVERLRRLTEQAVDVVEKALDRGDEIAAISLLQALGKKSIG